MGLLIAFAIGFVVGAFALGAYAVSNEEDNIYENYDKE